MAEVTRYTFHCASNQRDQGTNTDFNIVLKQIITKTAKNSSFYVLVHGITVPFSFYQLSSDINQLQVDISGEANPFTITLAPGNYTVISVLQQLSTRLTLLCQSLPVPFTPVFNFQYSQTTGRMTLISTAPALKTFTLRFSLNPTLGLFFGFTNDAIFNTATSATSTSIAVANPVTQLFLRSPSFQQNNNREWLVEKDTFCDILYRVPISTNAGTYIQISIDGEEILLSNDSFSIINLYLTTNLSYTPIDLQGLPFTVHYTIIEKVRTPFIPIGSDLLGNIVPTSIIDMEEMKRLQAEREDAIRRLEVYKEKLKIPVKEKKEPAS